MVLRLIVALSVSLTLVPGCGEDSQAPPESTADDREVAAAESRQADTPQRNPKPVPQLDMSLEELPVVENAELFTEKDEPAYDFFQSKKSDEGVRLKGKLYMKDEVSPEQRLENIEGGEVGVEVPLK